MTKTNWLSRRKARENPSAPNRKEALLFLGRTDLFFSVLIILALMFGLMLFSARGDAAIIDEVAHISAGYSYLTTGDYRLNPEHPPLIKDLAAMPLVFLKANFPYGYWQKGTSLFNNQWEVGWRFLYKLGNSPEQMILFSRLPVMALALVLGVAVFFWARQLYGDRAGLLALFFFVFDANIMAHSRLVTTDLGITAGVFLNIFSLWYFLRKPGWKRIFLVGLTLAAALLIKFSAVLLVPIYFLAFVGALWIKEPLAEDPKGFFSNLGSEDRRERFLGYCYSSAVIFLIAFFLVWLVYYFHTFQMPVSVQHALISESLAKDGLMVGLLHRMVDAPVLRPLAQYLLGFEMVGYHAAVGHDSFLMGQVSNKGWWYYYPVAFLIKTPVSALVFVSLGLLSLERRFKKMTFDDYFLLLPVVVWLGAGMASAMDIGLRHILPIYPMLFVFASRIMVLPFFKATTKRRGGGWEIRSLFPSFALGALMLWLAASNIFTYPYYLSYYNEVVGGPANGYKWLIDSNTDWGQDLKRLADYTQSQGIQKIAVDYFGGGLPEYYLGSRYQKWQVTDGKPHGYFALSLHNYQNSKIKKSKSGQEDYGWLDSYSPIARIGYSIVVFKLP